MFIFYNLTNRTNIDRVFLCRSKFPEDSPNCWEKLEKGRNPIQTVKFMRPQPAQLLVFKGHWPRPGNNLANVDVQVDTPYDQLAKVPANANCGAKFFVE